MGCSHKQRQIEPPKTVNQSKLIDEAPIYKKISYDENPSNNHPPEEVRIEGAIPDFILFGENHHKKNP